MFFRTLRAAACLAVAMAAWHGSSDAKALPYAPSKKLTIILDATLGPVLSGSDPAGLDGDSATVTVTVKESSNPYKTTANSASYRIPAGDISLTVNGSTYTSTSRSSMIIKLGKKADLLTLKANVTVYGHKVSVSNTSSLQSGSWDSNALQHPELFSPSPQDLTEPASTFTYTVLGETTVLGVTGTASNSE